eukprot:TRINITY_DN6216_c0_g1_i2.p1 TRINITY_DN6216_c0_g1~~TRINITY_DN6216_c0_g1_i2.p1  ORF type:complete len:639 (+),score=103.57 TRINITY_DN6216_c0_g1_i2:29-1945(+)
MDGSPARVLSRRSASEESLRGAARGFSPQQGVLLRTGSAHGLLDAEGTDGRSVDAENTSSSVALQYKIFLIVALVALVIAGLVFGRPWEVFLRPTTRVSAVNSSSQAASAPASTTHHLGGHLRSTSTGSPDVSTGTSKQTSEVGSTAAATVPKTTSTLRPTSRTSSASAIESQRTTSTEKSTSAKTTTTPEVISTSKRTTKTTSRLPSSTTTTSAAAKTTHETTSSTQEVSSQAPKSKTEPPVLTFYMYRAQSDENYSPENQNMANLAGVLWYLHNEIVFTSRWFHNTTAELRSGSKFSVPKTRIERFKVSTRAPKRLYERGMDFGVLHEFDSGRCTGPGKPGETHPPPETQCEDDYDRYGYTVGCESWKPNAASNHPHAMWNSINHYPGALWYSLPGSCPQQVWKDKTASCKQKHPGGACGNMEELLADSSSCTYFYEKVGELSIDELEGLKEGGFHEFVDSGGVEYDRGTDRGTHMSFWDFKNESYFCQKRIDHANSLFASKYPHLPHHQDPDCNFDMFKFYSAPGESPQKCDEEKCAAQHTRFSCATEVQSWHYVQWQRCCCPQPEVPSIAKCQAHMAESQHCDWTSKQRCPGQPGHPRAELATNDGSLAYECCCDLGLWDPSVQDARAKIELLL